ncbi:MAG: acyltransferase [Solirubrobacterales bacterium]|nr:acyltransferase [Solirubrobacterales bacterium]
MDSPWYKQLFAQLDIGVPFFFLLSGFLLYRPMLAARVSGLPKQKRSAYTRNRFFRIMPAYWVVLTVAAIVPGFYGAFTGHWWVYYGLLQSFPVYTPEGLCAVNPFRCGFPPAWSLSVEILFYISLPFFAAGMAKLTSLIGKRHWIPIELTVLAAISAVSLYLQSSLAITDLERWLFFSPLGRGYWFALGMGLAVASVWAWQQPREPKVVRFIAAHSGLWWLIGIAIYAFTAIVILDPGPSLAAPIIPQKQYLASVIAFGIVPFLVLLPAIFGSEQDGFVRRTLRHPTLVWLGLISYGIFLWHFPVMMALIDIGVDDWVPWARYPTLAICTFLVTICFAAASFYLLERPLMRWSRGRAQSEPPKNV